MGRKLTIVVTCTDRKSVEPLSCMEARSLPPGTPQARSEIWRDRLGTVAQRTPLRQLYQGETWSQVLKLEQCAQDKGFEPQLVVASAGLGLAHADTASAAYGATFTLGQLDSVGSSTQENRSWWTALRRSQASLESHCAGDAIMVLSRSYANAMSDELGCLDGRRDVVVFGGSDAVPASARIPSDKSLRACLGGTTTSLNARMAASWLHHLPSASVERNRDNPAWQSWAARSQRVEKYERSPATDQVLIEYVRQLRRKDPGISKSRALRSLRASNVACEQRRFGTLFDAAVAR